MPEVFQGVETDVVRLLANLGLVLVLGQVLAWHYLRFSPVLSDKRRLARVFVFIAATTMLVISVVKTSLALSLGLVGALSIIRFRTPIKDPEELAYLFLAIGLGLGMGADEPLVTVVVFAAVLLYMGVLSTRRARRRPPRLLLHVEGDVGEASDAGPEEALRRLMAEVEANAPRVDLRRVDAEGGAFHATLVLDLASAEDAGRLMSAVQRVFPSGSVSLVESSGLD